MLNQRQFKTISGSICAPLGFKAAAVFCDIKRLGTGKGSEKGRKNDLALIVSDVPAAVAGMFTTNRVVAPPVKISSERAAWHFARAIVVNSGNANACTGVQGMKDAIAMTRWTAEALAREYKEEIREEQVLVCSTGRIGIPMPIAKVKDGIRRCAPMLARSVTHARAVAKTIMTSDTRQKEIAVEFAVGDANVRVGGICKGAGMIQPRMGPGERHATMLAFITSDAAIESRCLKEALRVAVEQSFNRITVDGDMSTNDSVIALANTRAGNSWIHRRSRYLRPFQEALNFVCLELAKMIVRDGEGVSRFITVHVRNAKNAREAERAARAITSSSLVRTSWCGGDPNWGRILCAIGYSGAAMNEAVTDIGYGPAGQRKILYGFRQGRPTNTSFQALARITAAPEFDVHVDLRQGKGEFTIYASDLTEEYVAFNKGNVTDPASLGG